MHDTFCFGNTHDRIPTPSCSIHERLIIEYFICLRFRDIYSTNFYTFFKILGSQTTSIIYRGRSILTTLSPPTPRCESTTQLLRHFPHQPFHFLFLLSPNYGVTAFPDLP